MDVTNHANNATTSSEDFFSLSLNKPIFSRSTTALGMGAPSLRELDVNIVSQESHTAPLASLSDTLVPAPPLKKQNRGDGDNTKLPMKKMARKTVAGAGFGASHGPHDRENLTITNFSSSVGPGTRRLRSHGSQ
jgi:kinesin family protein 11